jgi:ribosomal protein S2
MVIYKNNVRSIAEYLFHKFYPSDEFDPTFCLEANDIAMNRCLDKAEKLYKFFDNVQDIKRMVEFLNIVNPNMAKEMVDEL